MLEAAAADVDADEELAVVLEAALKVALVTVGLLLVEFEAPGPYTYTLNRSPLPQVSPGLPPQGLPQSASGSLMAYEATVVPHRHSTPNSKPKKLYPDSQLSA